MPKYIDPEEFGTDSSTVLTQDNYEKFLANARKMKEDEILHLTLWSFNDDSEATGLRDILSSCSAKTVVLRGMDFNHDEFFNIVREQKDKEFYIDGFTVNDRISVPSDDYRYEKEKFDLNYGTTLLDKETTWKFALLEFLARRNSLTIISCKENASDYGWLAKKLGIKIVETETPFSFYVPWFERNDNHKKAYVLAIKSVEEVAIADKKKQKNLKPKIDKEVKELSKMDGLFATFTENNSWEAESFNFHILIDENFIKFIELFRNKYGYDLDLGGDTYDVKAIPYYLEQVRKMVELSESGYMNFENGPYKIDESKLGLILSDESLTDGAGWIEKLLTKI